MHISKRIWDWSPTELRYAQQLGVKHIMGYLPQEVARPVWDFLDVVQYRKLVESYGMELDVIAAPPAALMQEIIWAGPHRDQAIADFCRCVDNIGRAGIHVFAYNFSVYHTWGRWRNGLGDGGRGGAGLMSFDSELIKDAPVGEAGVVSAEEMWKRLAYFLERVVPAAEKSEVKLACHQDDPPWPVLQGAAQILHNLEGMKRQIEIVPSPSNGLLFCQGTVAEMGVDVIAAIRYFLERKKIFAVHFRNIRKLPGPGMKFDEVFIDEGDVDMAEAMRTYIEMGYDGLIDPDHAPVMESDSQYGRQRGYAYAIGYMTALKKLLER